MFFGLAYLIILGAASVCAIAEVFDTSGNPDPVIQGQSGFLRAITATVVIVCSYLIFVPLISAAFLHNLVMAYVIFHLAAVGMGILLLFLWHREKKSAKAHNHA